MIVLNDTHNGKVIDHYEKVIVLYDTDNDKEIDHYEKVIVLYDSFQRHAQ